MMQNESQGASVSRAEGRRIAYIDAQAGVSGDMLLAALVGLGIEPSFFEDLATRLSLPDIKVRARQVRRSGIQGWLVEVESREESPPRRTLRHIERMLEGSGIEGAVVSRSLAVFRCLAEAEAVVHGEGPEEIHFHEVGAADSIVDVVGVVAGLHELEVERVLASSLPLAPGTLSFSHGTHALPAPAVGELVQGMLVHGIDASGSETVTPTGAALVRTLASSQGPMPAMRVIRHGRGAGHRDGPGLANLLRIFLGWEAIEGVGGPRPSSALLVRATIDDMNPQLFPAAFERLFEAGAIDLYLCPVLMKKGRPGHLLEVLCPPHLEQGVVEALMRHTTTLGCRVLEARKLSLDRRERTVHTPYGDLPVKEALLHGKVLRRGPEHDVAAALALKHGVAVEEVLEAARRSTDPSK